MRKSSRCELARHLDRGEWHLASACRMRRRLRNGRAKYRTGLCSRSKACAMPLTAACLRKPANSSSGSWIRSLRSWKKVLAPYSAIWRQPKSLRSGLRKFLEHLPQKFMKEICHVVEPRNELFRHRPSSSLRKSPRFHPLHRSYRLREHRRHHPPLMRAFNAARIR